MRCRLTLRTFGLQEMINFSFLSAPAPMTITTSFDSISILSDMTVDDAREWPKLLMFKQQVNNGAETMITTIKTPMSQEAKKTVRSQVRRCEEITNQDFAALVGNDLSSIRASLTYTCERSFAQGRMSARRGAFRDLGFDSDALIDYLLDGHDRTKYGLRNE